MTLEALFAPGKTIPFSQAPAPPTRWLQESTEYLIEKGTSWFAVEAATGETRPFDRVKRLSDALGKLDAFSSPTVRRTVAKIEAFNQDYSYALVQHLNDLYLFDVAQVNCGN